MFKKSILFFIFIFINTISHGQQMMVSPNDQEEFTLGFTKVIGQSENGYFVLTSNLSLNTITDRSGLKTRKYKVGFFNTSLVRKWDRVLNPINDKASIDAIAFMNDQVMVISSQPEKATRKVKYFITYIDTSGKENKLTQPVTEFSISSSEYEKCKVIISSSKEKFALITREFLGDKNQPVFAAVIDENLEKVKTMSGIVPFSDRTFEFTGYALSNEGDLVMLGFNSEKTKAMSSKRKIDYYLYSSTYDTSGFREFNVSGNKIITGLGIAFDNVNRQAVLAGFYSDQESFSGAGLYYASLKMEPNAEVIIKARSIDSQQNIQLKGERNTGAGINLISYPIERIVVRQDGGAVIVAEAAYTTEYSYYDSFSQSFTRRLEYNFNNIIILSISNEGIADWSSVIEKEQVSLDDGGIFSSFCSLLNSEQLVVLYNDNISKRSKIIPVSVNNLGTTTPLKSFQQTEGIQLLPKSGKQVSENELVVPALIKRKLFLIKFTF